MAYCGGDDGDDDGGGDDDDGDDDCRPSGMMTMTIATSLLWAAPAFTLLPHEPALAARCGQFKSKYKYGATKIQNYKYISELQRCKPRHTLYNAP